MLKNLLLFIYISVTCISNGGIADSTVLVAGMNGLRMVGTGSGFVVTPGQVVTANHVAKMGRALRVRDPQGQWHNATVLKTGTPDWAILSVPGMRCDTLPVDRDGTRQGESIAAHGRFMSGMRCNGAGVVRDWKPFQGAYQHCTAQVYPGYSGGPVVDGAGKVVGIVSMETPGGSCLYVPIGRVFPLTQ